MTNQKVEISLLSVIKIIALLLGIALIYYTRGIILLLFVVFIIVAALDPLVENLQAKKVPRALSVVCIYLILLLLLAGVIYLIVPPLVFQIKELGNDLPDYMRQYEKITSGLNIEVWNWQNSLASISGELNKLSGGFLSAASTFFGGLFAVVTVFVLSFYLLLEEKGMKLALANFLPVNRKEAIIETLHKISHKIGYWIRGQLTLCLTIGFLDFLALFIIGIPFALTLGILAVFLELIPIIGPVITAVLSAIIALTTVGLVKTLIVIIVFILIQQLENNVLVPNIMKKAVGLSPVFIIVALLIAGELFGLIGVILAVPAAAIIMVVVEEWPNLTKVIKSN